MAFFLNCCSFQISELLYCSASAQQVVSFFVLLQLIVPTSRHTFASLPIELHAFFFFFQTFHLSRRDDF